jgi:hypothetical protein
MNNEDRGFGPVPRRLLTDLALEVIDLDDFAILCWLITNENQRSGEAFVGTTAELALRIKWEKTTDWLSRKIRRLERIGYLDTTVRRRSPKPYKITLAGAKWKGDRTRLRTDYGLEGPPESVVSSSSPKTEDGPSPLHETPSATLDFGVVRSPKTEDGRRKTEQQTGDPVAGGSSVAARESAEEELTELERVYLAGVKVGNPIRQTVLQALANGQRENVFACAQKAQAEGDEPIRLFASLIKNRAHEEPSPCCVCGEKHESVRDRSQEMETDLAGWDYKPSWPMCDDCVERLLDNGHWRPRSASVSGAVMKSDAQQHPRHVAGKDNTEGTRS